LEERCNAPFLRHQTMNGLPSNQKAFEIAPEAARGHFWTEDSAVLSMNGGETFACWLDSSAIRSTDWVSQTDEIPLSRVPQLIAEARSRSEEWASFAVALEIRSRKRSQ
jgi:hypothetical protein